MDSLIGGDKKLTGFTFMLKSKSKSGVKSTESHRRLEDVGLSNEASFSELARSILKFREIYERIKSWKQHQMMELEKQRIEFTKDVEFQRMKMLVGAQLEMEKSKREKHFNCSALINLLHLLYPCLNFTSFD
ncbi:hypothetical protein V6Z11_A13G015500 [Gossypium hirsutum]|uniref:Trihelix transcription factor ASIL2-like n=2 Tax=Gossypium TaxID=3633 RepID=A0ABR0MAB2_GOSAR|nr:hypothetical protein PVK06_046331 [Gossypium arboreum]PPS01741.1 hypothetical protein GOBAR_AA18909 [Gossypium barbadense]